MAPQSSTDCPGADLVVRCNRLDSAQKSLCIRFENRNTVIRTRKPFHCIQRIKQGDDHEFDLLRSVIAKNVPTLVAFDSAEAWKYGLLQ